MAIEVELIKPHKLQKEIVDAVTNVSTFLLTVICGRQFGKTTISENIALMWALEDSGSNILWVSPTESQSKKVYTETLNSVRDTVLVESYKGSKGEMEIQFINGSKIQFRGALSGDNLRGDSIHYLILDEASFIKRDTVEGVLLPSLSVTGKKVLIITTPKGKNWVYDYYLKGLDGTGGYYSLRFPSTESPLMNTTILQMFKDTFTKDMYRQEILAEFIDVSSVFKDFEQLATLKEESNPVNGKNYWAGIDIGLITDATVISILDDNGDLVKFYRFVGEDTNDLLNEFRKIFNKWNFSHIFIENNNQGLPIFQLLKPEYGNLSQFNTNTKTKREIIDDLIFRINKKEMRFVKEEILLQEFDNFKFQQTSTGHLQYLAENGYSDDIVMATAIANRCWREKRDKEIRGYGF